MTTTRFGAIAFALLLGACSADTFSAQDGGESDADADADSGKDKIKLDGGGDSSSSVDAQEDGGTADAPADVFDGSSTGARRVFVTFQGYNVSSIGNLPTADAICNSTASQQGLGGTWMAWLSSSSNSVSARFNHNGGPFKLLNGTVIAADWNQLTSGTLQAPIDHDEHGQKELGQCAWTGTLYNATTTTGLTCNDWTTTAISQAAEWGRSNSATSTWSGIGDASTTTCGDSCGFYCFEQ